MTVRLSSSMPPFWMVLLLGIVWTTPWVDSLSIDPNNNGSLITIPLIPYHKQRARRGLTKGDDDASMAPRRRQEAQQVGALYHGYGTHYADLWCGTPPQRQTVIVDTGSGVTAFPCSGCPDCGSPVYHIDQYFQESESSTFETMGCDQCSVRGRCTADNECRIGMSYQEGSSWSAYEARDVCYVGGFHNVPIIQDDGGTEDIDPGHASAFKFPLQFGCQTKITGLFKTQLADGIMGMEDSDSSFWAQMYEAKKIKKQAFSLCFSRPEHADRDGTEAGAMTLGGTDKRLHHTPMVFSSNAGTDTDGRGGFFSVHIRAMYMRPGGSEDIADVVNLNQSETNLNSGGVIVDSGTTDTYFSSHIQAAFRATFHQMSGLQYSNNKIGLSDEELLALPTILFQISGDEKANKQVVADNGGDPNKIPGLAGDIDPDHPYDVILAIPPSHYMEGENGIYVNRFYDTEQGGSVLGANSMMGNDILFDADNHRIGWAESSCDYTKLITGNGYTDVLSMDPESGSSKDTPSPSEAPIEGDEKATEVENPSGDATSTPAKEEAEEQPPLEPNEVEPGESTQEKETPPAPAAPEESQGEESSEEETSEDLDDGVSPDNSIFNFLTGNCSGLVCGGGVIVSILFTFLFVFGICWCRCGAFWSKPILYQTMPEVEMTNGKTEPSYKDDFVDEDEEYGAELRGKTIFKRV